jgi:uncharacterized protein (TIGR00369 family)
MNERDDPLWHFVHNRLPGPPSARFLGWRCVELDVARGTIAVEFTPTPECLNPARGIAGGFIAQMLDATIGPGVAITLEPGQFPTTVEFKVCFLRPIGLGKVIGRARIVHRGEAMVFAEGELRDPDNRLLATATETLRIVTIQNVELDFGQGAAEQQL